MELAIAAMLTATPALAIALLGVGQPIDELSDVFAKQLRNLLNCGVGIFDRVMQERGRNQAGFRVTVLNKNAGDAFKVHDVGGAVVLALLVAVLFDRKFSRRFYKPVHDAATLALVSAFQQ
jgi:hypothetical protein